MKIKDAKNKLFKRIILIASILILSLVGFCNISFAGVVGVWIGNENSGRPQTGVLSAVGQLPQITNKGYPVFCGDFGVAVRSGKIDTHTYYLDESVVLQANSYLTSYAGFNDHIE